METNAGKVYNEYYEQGLEFQDFVYRKLWSMGMSFLTFASYKEQKVNGDGLCVEIKYDRKLADIGNVFIETSYLYNGNVWKPSGIYTGAPVFYVIGDYTTFYVLSVRQLKKYCDVQSTITTNNGSAKGVLLNQNTIDRLAILIVKCN